MTASSTMNDDGSLDMLVVDISQVGRYRPTILHVSKKGEIDYTDMPVEISVHALERLIQYYHIREFHTMHPALAGVICGLAEYCLNGKKWPNDLLNMVTPEGKVQGHFTLQKSETRGGMILTTWVGERSYTERQREVVSKVEFKDAAVPGQDHIRT